MPAMSKKLTLNQETLSSLTSKVPFDHINRRLAETADCGVTHPPCPTQTTWHPPCDHT